MGGVVGLDCQPYLLEIVRALTVSTDSRDACTAGSSKAAKSTSTEMQTRMLH